MVHVFKTSVCSEKEVRLIGSFLNILLAKEDWNFDLEDCDKVLRVKAAEISAEIVITILNSQGFECSELVD